MMGGAVDVLSVKIEKQSVPGSHYRPTVKSIEMRRHLTNPVWPGAGLVIEGNGVVLVLIVDLQAQMGIDLKIEVEKIGLRPIRGFCQPMGHTGVRMVLFCLRPGPDRQICRSVQRHNRRLSLRSGCRATLPPKLEECSHRQEEENQTTERHYQASGKSL